MGAIPLIEGQELLESVREAKDSCMAHNTKDSAFSSLPPSSRTMLEEFRTSCRLEESASTLSSSVTESPNSILRHYSDDVSWLEPKNTEDIEQIHTALFAKKDYLDIRVHK